MSSILDNPGSGLLLRRARFDLGLTRKALARRIGVTPRTITNWERGHLPSPEHAKAVAETFGVKPTDIFVVGPDE